jgi:competence protein ComEA
MRLQRRNEERGAFLLLLSILLGISFAARALPVPAPAPLPCREKVYVEVTGEVNRPGVYVFCGPPSAGDLVSAAEGRRNGPEGFEREAGPFFASGDRVIVRRESGRRGFARGQLPGFYKLSRGIPLSLNQETAAGLSALPGIGPRLAGLIVEERSRRGGFSSLEELTSVRGIGRSLYEKVKPHLVL